MDVRPVGVFDSGLGGLTSLRELESLLPGEKIIYLGDTGNVPYGGRPAHELLFLSGRCVDFLLGKNVKLILAACGTSSAAALPELTKSCPMPLLGILEPTSRRAAEATSNGRVGVIATQATITSGAFPSALKKINPDLSVFPLACPPLVPAIEAGHFSPDDETARHVAKAALQPLMDSGIDTLILGCTHYRLMGELIGELMGEAVTLVDSGAEASRVAADFIRGASLKAPAETGGETEFFVSGEPLDFARGAESFLSRDISQKVYHVSL